MNSKFYIKLEIQTDYYNIMENNRCILVLYTRFRYIQMKLDLDRCSEINFTVT